METVMAAEVDERQWYLAVDDKSLGPISTEVVVRGIVSGKVPTTAWVCLVGASEWLAISSVVEFQRALAPNAGSEEAPPKSTLTRGMQEPLEYEASHVAERSARTDSSDVQASWGGQASDHGTGGFEIDIDDGRSPRVNWTERFHSYFLIRSAIELPEEEHIIASLSQTPRSAFLHDEALWNLSLCLAFGSERVAQATAAVVHEAIASHRDGSHAEERLEWVCRTLLSKGFMPSGIPRVEGRRGLDILRAVSPSSYAAMIIDRAASS